MGRIISERLAGPDDPIYKGVVETLSVRKPKRGMSAEDIEQFGQEASAGMQAQSDGEDPNPVRGYDRK